MLGSTTNIMSQLNDAHSQSTVRLNKKDWDLLAYATNVDEKLRDHLSNAKEARNTSKDIQNDLLDSVYEVYLAQVK